MAEMTEDRFESVVSELLEMIGEWPAEHRSKFVGTEKADLIQYHHGFGTSIRNHFRLWEYEWEKTLENGVDVSPNHPDQMSQRIIETAWDRLQNENTG